MQTTYSETLENIVIRGIFEEHSAKLEQKRLTEEAKKARGSVADHDSENAQVLPDHENEKDSTRDSAYFLKKYGRIIRP